MVNKYHKLISERKFFHEKTKDRSGRREKMKRKEILSRLGYHVPNNRIKRVIIDSDIAAEADDAFALVHHLLTPSEDVVGIIAANFEWKYRTIPKLREYRLKSMEKSFAEGKKILEIMDIDDVPLYRGAEDFIEDPKRLPDNEGSDFIVREAMRETEEPLYIALQGSLTDLAMAYLRKPEIAKKIAAAIWIGGGAYPKGGQEANLRQDVYAAQVIFASDIPLWQIPVNVYGSMNLTFAELTTKVRGMGLIGDYLCEKIFEVNDWYGSLPGRMSFPHGETWSIGDQPTVSVLLENESGQRRSLKKAPKIAEDMTYLPGEGEREIYVYDDIDRRMTMDDLFAKLALCYGGKKM